MKYPNWKQIQASITIGNAKVICTNSKNRGDGNDGDECTVNIETAETDEISGTSSNGTTKNADKDEKAEDILQGETMPSDHAVCLCHPTNMHVLQCMNLLICTPTGITLVHQ
jgi:hypothetical protein